jgi:hypothetical protein
MLLDCAEWQIAAGERTDLPQTGAFRLSLVGRPAVIWA